MNYINNLLYKEQSPHNPQPLTESSDYSMAYLFNNKINNINYNTTTTSNLSYIMVAIPQPPKVYAAYPSEPIGYECRGRDTDTDDDVDNDHIVIIDIMS